MKQESVIKGALLCSIAGIAWGAQFPIAGDAMHHIDPFYFTLIRYASVAVILLILLAIIEGKKALSFEGRWKSLWFFGTMAFTVYNFLVFLGQKMTGSSGAILASIMMSMIPVGSVIVMWSWKKVKPSGVTLTCVIIALIGVLIVVSKGNISYFASAISNLVPALIMLIGVLGWVVYTVGGSNFPSWSPLRYTALSCVLGTFSALIIVVICTLAGVLKVPTAHTVASIGWDMSYMIVIAGVLAVFSWNAGNKILKPINGSLFINLVPVVAFIISVIGGYKMSGMEIFGAVITILALFGNNFNQRKKMAKPAAEKPMAPVKQTTSN